MDNALLATLESRFMKNMYRHTGLKWQAVLKKLQVDPAKLQSLAEMERTSGEPDVIGIDPQSGKFIFCDCSLESPAGRRSLCYDRSALDARKENKPNGNAIEMAAGMGVEILNEQQFRALQEIEPFDQKTSSWIATPEAIRTRGGALFCDCRYGQVFTYHNGAESYYAARGFRGRVLV